jgi:hypothetical protein
MFTDPVSLTVDAVEKELPRIEVGGSRSLYALPDQSLQLTISHQSSKKRIRSMVRLDVQAIVADPLTSENDYENCAIYLVVDRPEKGFSTETVSDHAVALMGFCDVNTLAKIYGKET